MKQPSLALGVHRGGTHFPSPHAFTYSPRAGRVCFFPLPLPSGLTPISACPPLPHPETPMLSSSPFPPLPGGLAMATCTKLLSMGGQQPAGWGLMDLMLMADADTPALAQREMGPAQVLCPCGVREGSLREMGSMRARRLGAASAQQHAMAQASCLYPTAASPPTSARNPASHPGEGSHSPQCLFLQFS